MTASSYRLQSGCVAVVARVLTWQDALRYVCLFASLADGVRRHFLRISWFYD